MEQDGPLLEFRMEPAHESWLDCYRLALDFGPVIAEKAIASLTDEQQLSKTIQPV